MEDREMVREKHGIANARRVSAAEIQNSDIQSVTVTDGKECEVLLSISTSNFPAALTPDQAKMIAKMLNASADRVLKNQ